jgi:hypothetical protein
VYAPTADLEPGPNQTVPGHRKFCDATAARDHVGPSSCCPGDFIHPANNPPDRFFLVQLGFFLHLLAITVNYCPRT